MHGHCKGMCCRLVGLLSFKVRTKQQVSLLRLEMKVARSALSTFRLRESCGRQM